MRSHPLRMRLLAFCLLLIFSQKAGVGLVLHNLFHGNSGKTAAEKQTESRSIGFDCSCKDDLSMPFLETDSPDFSIYASCVSKGCNANYDALVLPIPDSFFGRGPPAHLL